MAKTLCLYTAQYPYGLEETFMETEIGYLAEAFERVVIFARKAGETRREVPPNVEVRVLATEGYTTARGLASLGTWMGHCLGDVRSSSERNITWSTLLRVAYDAKQHQKLLGQLGLLNDTLHYTYWFEIHSTLLSILTSKGVIPGFVSRAHGFDLYEERHRLGFIPFRRFQLKHVSRLFLISRHGLDYMNRLYPRYKQKYALSYLGVGDGFVRPPAVGEERPFLVVSCSNIVRIKRVGLLVEALSGIADMPIHWVHFGSGPLLDEVREAARSRLGPNLTFEFKGRRPNAEVLAFYGAHHVDCFINVSSSEGLPVSLMEAVCHGIPVIGTDVGGTSEVVTGETGILLGPDPDAETVRSALETVLRERARNEGARERVRSFWEAHFDARKNYPAFARTLKAMQ